MALIIYLQRYPENKNYGYLYSAVWIGFFTIIQSLFAHKGMFVYDNGWNGWHNIWLNIALFAVLRVHYRKPAMAMLISLPAVVIFYLLFPFPLESLK